jgi:hypothetical protein
VYLSPCVVVIDIVAEGHDMLASLQSINTRTWIQEMIDICCSIASPMVTLTLVRTIIGVF